MAWKQSVLLLEPGSKPLRMCPPAPAGSTCLLLLAHAQCPGEALAAGGAVLQWTSPGALGTAHLGEAQHLGLGSNAPRAGAVLQWRASISP